MELNDVVSVAGIGGLHRIVGRRATGLILETLDAQAKRFPSNLSQKISILEDISIYTIDGEVRLREVLLSIHEKDLAGASIPSKKDSENVIRAFVEEVLPNYDKERVYISDLKKLVQWYGILKDRLDWEALAKEDESEESDKPKAEVKEKKTEPKKTAPKKTAAPKSANVKMKTNTPRKTGGA